MQSPLVLIQQSGKELGWGKLGAMTPKSGETTEITMHDVQMADSVDFIIEGPFRITVEDKRYDKCTPVNFSRIRPGCTYDRVIFTTDLKPVMERISRPDSENNGD